MICLSCHGPNDLTLGYVSRDSSLIIGQLEWIKLFYLYKCNRIENAWFSGYSRSGWDVPFLCVARCFFSFKNVGGLRMMVNFDVDVDVFIIYFWCEDLRIQQQV